MRATEDAQTSRESPDGESVERALDSGVTSMAVDSVSGDPERPESSPHPTPQGETSETGGSDGPGGGTVDASGTAPVGLGLGGLQPLPARVSEYMLLVVDMKVACRASRWTTLMHV